MERVPYISRAKVLLSGLGSDELLGGYARHRNAFAQRSWEGLLDEVRCFASLFLNRMVDQHAQLQLDLDRLPSRNLGRDDRVISAHGKETRYPFLSLSVVSFAASLPVTVKLDPRLEEGTGDKRLLRLVAERLGLVKASKRKKRWAIIGRNQVRD